MILCKKSPAQASDNACAGGFSIQSHSDNIPLKFENGIPTYDIFQRIFAIIKTGEFEKCFMNWVKSVINIPKTK